MEPFLYYLLRSSICLLLFYGFFLLTVKGSTFHRLNRVLLLLLLTASMILPLFQCNLLSDLYQQNKPASVNQIIVHATSGLPEATAPASVSVLPWTQLISFLYISGVFIVFGYYLMAWIQVRRIIQISAKSILPDGTTLHVTNKKIAPFTWMNKIVISETDMEHNGEIILKHEQAHVRLNHSTDLLFITIISLLFWFNPFIWLFKRSLQQIHEFEADRQVLNDGIDATQYKLVLIRRSAGEQTFAMANNFTYRSLHKRIQMMTKKKSGSLSGLYYWGIIPVALLAAAVLSVPAVNAQQKETVPMTKLTPAKKTETVPMTKLTPAKKTESIPMTKLTPAMKTKKRSKVVKPSSANIQQFDFDDAEKDQIGSERVQIVAQGGTHEAGNRILVRGIGSLINGTPLYIVDGEKRVSIDDLDPNTVESVSVLKNKSATDLYGKDGEHGVVIINLKKENK